LAAAAVDMRTILLAVRAALLAALHTVVRLEQVRQGKAITAAYAN
jgi:hypothetical protein